MFLETSTYMKHHETTQKFSTSSVFPILSAEKLLGGPEHAKLLHKLQSLVAVSPNHYDVLYTSLIHNFAEFVQVLPLGESGRVASVLNEGLEHALVSMQLLSETGITRQDQLLTYAVFSAALLQDIGKVVVNRKIMICDRQGLFIHEWSAHGQPMPQSVGSHFKIRYTQDAPLRMSSRVTPIFARQLMPERGYSWIASHPEMLTMWLAALGDTTDDDAGTVGIKLLLALRKLKAEQSVHLPEIPVDIFEAPATKHGEAFWQWLQEGLQTGSIPVDKPGSGVESVAGGLLLHDQAFRNFHEGFMKEGDWIVTQAEFNYLGLVELSGEDKIIEKYFSRPHDGVDKAAHFASNSSDHLSYLAKQFHSLTSDVGHSTQHPISHTPAKPSAEIRMIIESRFLPDLSHIVKIDPKPTTAEDYFAREMELRRREQPPMYQPEIKH